MISLSDSEGSEQTNNVMTNDQGPHTSCKECTIAEESMSNYFYDTKGYFNKPLFVCQILFDYLLGYHLIIFFFHIICRIFLLISKVRHWPFFLFLHLKEEPGETYPNLRCL